MLHVLSPRPKRSKPLLSGLFLLLLIYLLIHRIGPAVHYYAFPYPHPKLLEQAEYHLQGKATNISVNLIIASVATDRLDWVSGLQIPNLQILRYISDDPHAEYHPPAAKGREALQYFTFLYDFYDFLPDISIFVHAEETPWHIEGTLLQNTTFALSQLDLEHVVKREYFNLRVTWRAACPAWIDTTKTFDNWDKTEEPYMREAWAANFGDTDPIPAILGGPCCSQFAVTREAIRRRPREQYKKSRDWLMQSDWSDYVSGRVWEHLWPKLFKNESSDCSHEERESLCEMYGICFTSDQQLSEYKELWEERERLKEKMSFLSAVVAPGEARVARRKMSDIREEIEQQLHQAWLVGKDPSKKAGVLKKYQR